MVFLFVRGCGVGRLNSQELVRVFMATFSVDYCLVYAYARMVNNVLENSNIIHTGDRKGCHQ